MIWIINLIWESANTSNNQPIRCGGHKSSSRILNDLKSTWYWMGLLPRPIRSRTGSTRLQPSRYNHNWRGSHWRRHRYSISTQPSITGQQDNIFCNPTGTQITPGNCGRTGGIVDQTRTIYPAASNAGNYYWEVLRNMGKWKLCISLVSCVNTGSQDITGTFIPTRWKPSTKAMHGWLLEVSEPCLTQHDRRRVFRIFITLTLEGVGTT